MDEGAVIESVPDLKDIEAKIGRKTPEGLLKWMREEAASHRDTKLKPHDTKDHDTGRKSLDDKIKKLKVDMAHLRSVDVKILQQLLTVHEGIEAVRWLLEERSTLTSRCSSLTSSQYSLGEGPDTSWRGSWSSLQDPNEKLDNISVGSYLDTLADDMDEYGCPSSQSESVLCSATLASETHSRTMGGSGAKTGAGTGSGVKTGAGTGSGAKAGAGTGSGTKTGAGTGSGVKTGAGTGSGAKAGAGTGSGVKTGAGTGSGVKTGAGTGSGAKAGAGTGSGAKAGAGTGSGTKAGAGIGSGAKAGAGTGSGTKTGAGTGSGTKAGSGTGSGVKPGAGTGAKAGSGACAGTGAGTGAGAAALVVSVVGAGAVAVSRAGGGSGAGAGRVAGTSAGTGRSPGKGSGLGSSQVKSVKQDAPVWTKATEAVKGNSGTKEVAQKQPVKSNGVVEKAARPVGGSRLAERLGKSQSPKLKPYNNGKIELEGCKMNGKMHLEYDAHWRWVQSQDDVTFL